MRRGPSAGTLLSISENATEESTVLVDVWKIQDKSKTYQGGGWIQIRMRSTTKGSKRLREEAILSLRTIL